MRSNQKSRSNISLFEQFNRRNYVLSKSDRVNWIMFQVFYNGTQSYYSFRPGCGINTRVRRMFAGCHTIEMDFKPVTVITYNEIRLTDNLTVTVIDDPVNPNPKTSTYQALQIDLRRLMFQIFAIEQTNKRLVAQVNALPSGSSKLPVPDAYSFTADIAEGLNDKEFELVLAFCLIIDDMRNYINNEDDDKEDFYDTV